MEKEGHVLGMSSTVLSSPQRDGQLPSRPCGSRPSAGPAALILFPITSVSGPFLSDYVNIQILVSTSAFTYAQWENVAVSEIKVTAQD